VPSGRLASVAADADSARLSPFGIKQHIKRGQAKIVTKKKDRCGTIGPMIASRALDDAITPLSRARASGHHQRTPPEQNSGRDPEEFLQVDPTLL